MVLDIIFLVLAVFGFYTGFSRGIIKAVFAIVSLLLGFMVAVRFAPFLADILQSFLSISPTIVFLIGFVLCFLLTMGLIRLLAKGLEGILKTVSLNFINKIAGGLLMGGLFILGLSVLVWFGDRAGLITDSTKETSISYPTLKAFPGQINEFKDRMVPQVKGAFDESAKRLDELKEKAEEQSN